MIEAWSPVCGAIERRWSLQGAEPSGRRLGHWEHALGGDIGTLALSFCFLGTMK
jgi:hypothetical protein